MLKTTNTKLKASFLLVLIICGFGLWLRLYHNDFGLPDSYHADEPEFVEYAINYTFNLRQIIADNDYYKLIPVSFVYGTLPTYILTVLTMVFSKAHTILNLPLAKEDIYIFLRTFTGTASFIIAPLTAMLYFKLFKDKTGSLITLFLVAFNWKLIVLSHYVNADTLITLFLLAAFYFTKAYTDNNTSKKAVYLIGLFFGLAVATKVTVLISVPAFMYIFLKRKDVYGLLIMLFTALGVFVITNPFSIVFFDKFIFRIVTLGTKEAGLVFDSVDLSYFKYISGLSFMLSLPVFLASLYGMLKIKKTDFIWFLLLNIGIYFAFYSIQSRRVDRWLLPTLPVMLIFAAYAVAELKKYKLFLGLAIASGIIYLYYPALLLTQFRSDTPRSAAYKWLQTSLPGEALKLGYTEEGLDPINRVDGMDMNRMGVYSSENAQFAVPKDPLLYDYVLLASKPMEYYKKPEVKAMYPFYYERWSSFENTVLDETKFKLIKEFTLPKPNLIPLTDIFVYEKVK